MTLKAVTSQKTTSQTPTTLVCVSNAEESAIALKFSCLRALRRGHEVTILHVVEPTEFQGLAAITDAIREEREKEADDLLKLMKNMATEQGVEHPTLMLREDSLSNGILSAIEENPNINMIMLAIHPDSHRGPKLMAALAEEIGTTITVPIMMIPGNLSLEKVEALS